MQSCQETYEISKICRCCLKNIGEMRPLYGFSLDKMLCSVADLQVEPCDGLPELLCFQCVLQLSRAFRFREQCRKSNEIIREYIKINEQERTKSLSVGENVCNQRLLKNVDLTTAKDVNRENIEYHTTSEDDQDTSSMGQNGDEFDTTPNKEDENFETNGHAQFIHITSNTNEYKCEICSKQFSGRKQLVRHVKTHDDNKPYRCSECNKTFAERCNLKKHLLKHTGELRNATNKPHLCSICGNNFKYSSSLSKHMKFHTGRNLLYCPHCPKYYVEKSALKIHLRCHTGDRPHVCNQCDRRFTQVCNLRKHLRTHNGERLFKCPICERTFTERDYLTIHLQTHSLEKKALCSICGKRFANPKTLDAHMRTHDEKRSFICGYENCSKTFARLDTALVHRRIHSGEKPYSCVVCSHSFTTSTQLSNHLRTHTGEKPYACEQCPRKCSSKKSLKTHSNKHSTLLSSEDAIHQIHNQLDSTTTPLLRQEVPHQQGEVISEQMFEESVLLFKINEDGELVPETESTSIAKVSTIQQ